jgi:hypothetical protein
MWTSVNGAPNTVVRHWILRTVGVLHDSDDGRMRCNMLACDSQLAGLVVELVRLYVECSMVANVYDGARAGSWHM